MSNLERASREGVIIAKKMARVSKTKRGGFWRGKKIVTEEEWHKEQRNPFDDECLKYIPETFSDTIFFLVPPSDENQYNARAAWKKDYFDFLEQTKNPEYGRKKCKGCPFNEFKISWGLQTILLKYLEKNLLDYKPSCDIFNIFECPYGYEKDAKELLIIGRFFVLVDEALGYCWDLTRKHESALYVNFLSERMGYKHGYITSAIWEKMTGLKVPRLSLYDVRDVYDVLTRPELMELLLDQYIDALGTGNYRNIVQFESPSFVVEQVEACKEIIIEFFAENKELVKLEDLEDCYGYDLEREESNRQQKIQDEKRLEVENPKYFWELKDRNNSGICLVCNGFAKVCCINCNKWLCADHWEEHGFEKHHFVMNIPDYYFEF